MSVTYNTAFDYMDEIYTSDYHEYLEDENNSVARTKVEFDLLCMKAIDKQILKKPISKNVTFDKKEWYHCPSCDMTICCVEHHINRNKYCCQCGQAWDWSE